MFASADGEAWEIRHVFGGSFFSSLVVGPDGALWLGTNRTATEATPTVVWRSGDGGRTWAPAQDGYDLRGVNALVAGRDGRLYLGGTSGVWRTNRLFATAGETEPDATDALGVRIFPNPTGGTATVALTLAAPERVTVGVYDVRGREVLAVWEGAASDGQRFAVETAGLAPGVYRVRATTASGARASAGLTVVR